MEFVNGKDDNPYMKWKITNVWNHQPVHYPFIYAPIKKMIIQSDGK